MNSQAYERLERLIDRARSLVETDGDYYTEGNKLAIRDLIDRSTAVLEGTYDVPFVRSREFYKPREEENIHFATRRFTKTPSYRMLEYGMEPALEWFEKQHVLNEEKVSLEEKLSVLTDQIQSVLEDSTAVFDETALKNLEQDRDKLKSLTDQTISRDSYGKAIVQGYDLLRATVHTRRLLTEHDPDANLYFSGPEFERFKKGVMSDRALNEQLTKIKEIADSNTPEQIELLEKFMEMDIDYKLLNKYFYIWSTTDKIINFTSPDNAAYAGIKFVLPSCENEEDGLGHVWIDDVQVYPASGADWDIKNSGFERSNNASDHNEWSGADVRPEFWSPISEEGKPVLRLEREYPFCGLDKGSIFIQNRTPEDQGAWSYDEDISITPGINNTLTFKAKIDGKLKEGLKVLISFKDKDKRIISEKVMTFNRKSSLATADFILTVQTDAIMYAFTEDITYAEKVKRQLFFILNDFCQGIEHWLVCSSRPDGSDAYGAVQGGRIMCSVMSAYTLVKKANLLSDDEIKHFTALMDYFVRFHLDLRDRWEMSAYECQADAGNWQTDMAAGTGMLMMGMPDFPNSRQWLENANRILRNQLKFKVNEDGSWPESIRYHFASFMRFLVYGKALANCTGENWFTDGPFLKMFRYAVDMQTPPYELQDDRIATIMFGDHIFDAGRGFYLAGIYYNDVKKHDAELASHMLQSWQKAGALRGAYRGESVALENLFGAGDIVDDDSKYPLKLESCDDYPNSGIYTFRQNYGEEDENLFAIMAPPKKVSHGHYDVGSFMIFKNRTPVVVDLGINGYFDSSKDWLVSSSSHSVVQFSRRDGKAEPQPYTIHLEISDYSAQRGWVDTPRTCEVLEFTSDEEINRIVVKIDNPEGEGYHMRKVTYFRNAGIYLIADSIHDFDRDVRFSMTVASNQSEVKGKAVHSDGMFGVDLETVFLSDVKEVHVEKGRTAPMFKPVDGKNVVDVIRAVGTGEGGFLTLVYPKVKGTANLVVEKNGDTYTVDTPDGNSIVFSNI